MPDNTVDIDKMIDDGVAEAKDMLKEFASLAPRPLGMSVTNPTDAFFDWQHRDASYWPRLANDALMNQMTRGGNVGDALLDLLKHDEAMRAMVSGDEPREIESEGLNDGSTY